LYKKRALFYPCAGCDILTPIRAFEATIDEFWFVDSNEYRDGRRPALPKEVHAKEVQQTQSILNDTKYPVTTYKYQTNRFNKTVAVNLVNGDAVNVFDRLFRGNQDDRILAVFFHRGDSRGEGGSDIYWLSTVDGEGEPNELLHLVLNTISKPGILCTDGSNADPAFKNYFDDLKALPDPHMRLNDFEIVGCRLSPISTLDTRYGQTIAWQVTQ
jgi:hypothetical protein